jgi:hypothetical protein
MVQTRKAQREATTPTLAPKQEDSEPTPAANKRRASPSASLTRGQAPKRARRGVAAATAPEPASTVAVATQHAGASTPADSADAAQQQPARDDGGATGGGASAALAAAATDAAAAAASAAAAAIAPPVPLPPTEQVTWEPQLGEFMHEPGGSACPSPQSVALELPTSANAAVWQEYGDDTDIFNVGLVADTSAPPGTPPVAVAAVDLLAASDWFRLLVGMRSRMGGGAGGREGGLRALPLPLRVPRSALVTIVQGVYEGRLQLSVGNVEAVLRVADACQVRAQHAARSAPSGAPGGRSLLLERTRAWGMRTAAAAHVQSGSWSPSYAHLHQRFNACLLPSTHPHAFPPLRPALPRTPAPKQA